MILRVNAFWQNALYTIFLNEEITIYSTENMAYFYVHQQDPTHFVYTSHNTCRSFYMYSRMSIYIWNDMPEMDMCHPSTMTYIHDPPINVYLFGISLWQARLSVLCRSVIMVPVINTCSLPLVLLCYCQEILIDSSFCRANTLTNDDLHRHSQSLGPRLSSIIRQSLN